MLLTEIDPVEADVDARHDGEAALGGVGDSGERVDRGNLERQVDAAASGQFGGQHEQIGRVAQWRKRPGEHQREGHSLDGIGGVGKFEHLVLELDHDSGVDLEGEVKIERSTTRIFGVQIDLPCLTHGIRLDEMPLVMDMERMIDSVILEIGYETRDIDDCHGTSLP